jgi:hypothetical protein
MSKTVARRVTACLAACILSLCCACVGQAWRGGSAERGERQPLKANMNVDVKGRTECAGRFQFVAPEALAVAGRSQSIYRVEVSTVPLPAGGLDELWRERVARIKSLRPPEGLPTTLIKTFDLQQGVRAAWYFANPDDDEQLSLEALKPVADYAVLASRGGMSGGESGVETLVKNVLDAYIHTQGAARGFCVGEGTITSEPGLNEHALVTLEHRYVRAFELKLDTQTVKEPDTRTYSDLDEERQVTAAHGGHVEVLREQARFVVGLEGKEIWASVASPEEAPFLRFTWHFPGVPGDSSRPMINVRATAPRDSRAELEAVWESVLGSLRAIPPSPSRP